jgi:3-dehydroquinate synthase
MSGPASGNSRVPWPRTTGTMSRVISSTRSFSRVVGDLEVLLTLPHDDLVAGLAEVLKCGFIADPEILTMIASDPAAAVEASSPVLRELIER